MVNLLPSSYPMHWRYESFSAFQYIFIISSLTFDSCGHISKFCALHCPLGCDQGIFDDVVFLKWSILGSFTRERFICWNLSNQFGCFPKENTWCEPVISSWPDDWKLSVYNVMGIPCFSYIRSHWTNCAGVTAQVCQSWGLLNWTETSCMPRALYSSF